MEYVEIGRLVIGRLDQVDLEQLRVGHENAGYFGAGERRQHLVLRVGAHDDGGPIVVCFAQLGVVELLEDEWLGRELDLSLEGELRHLLSSRAEPALPQTSIVSPGSGERISTSGASSRSSSGVPARIGNVP